MDETCERCGAGFECRVGEGDCWCAGVAVDRERLAKLDVLAERCLCPRCLPVASAGGEQPVQDRIEDGAPRT